MSICIQKPRKSYLSRLLENIKQHWELYLLMIPALAFFIVMKYVPMYGVQIAFRDYHPGFTMAESEWIGFDNFTRFFRSYQSKIIIGNTLKISLMSLILGFPGPILLALMLNFATNLKYKKTVQTITYAPHFLSTVAMAGMITLFFSSSGLFNGVRRLLGYDTYQYLGKANLFPWIYVISNIWQQLGWNSIIYIAALAAIDQNMYEAARIDGANRLKIMWYIELPSILPTIVILLIMNCGKILQVGHDEILLLQNPLNTSTSEIISTYVYKIGLQNSDYGYSTAINLFDSVVNLVMLILVNFISRRVSDISLW